MSVLRQYQRPRESRFVSRTLRKCFDGIEVRAVGRQVAQAGACGLDHLMHPWPLWLDRLSMIRMSPARSSGMRTSSSFEGIAVDRTIEHPRGDDAACGQTGDEGRCLPMAMWNAGPQTLAARASAITAGHIGRGPSLIDEDEAARIKSGLIVDPILPPLHDVRALLFAAVRGLFYA
jgi:hypothetical protein